MKNPKSIFANFFSNIAPQLTCPLAPGNYSIKDSSIDMTNLSFFPIDGFIINLLIKIVASDPTDKRLKSVKSCMKFELKILKVKV